MLRINFVCWGNICRSPMAEFILKDMVKKRGIADRFLIESSATSDEEIRNGIGNPVYPPAREELARHEISCAGKRARQLVKSDYARYDYFIGMEDLNIRYMRSILGNDPEGKISKLLDFTSRGGDIADPWYNGHFDRTYADIAEGCEGFLDKLQREGKLQSAD